MDHYWVVSNVSTIPKLYLFSFSMNVCWLLFFWILWKTNEQSYKLWVISKTKARIEVKYPNKILIRLNLTYDYKISAISLRKQKSFFFKWVEPLRHHSRRAKLISPVEFKHLLEKFAIKQKNSLSYTEFSEEYENNPSQVLSFSGKEVIGSFLFIFYFFIDKK